MIVGYARASLGLSTEAQQAELKAAGCVVLFIEQSTNPSMAREEGEESAAIFTKAIDRQAGDVLVVTKLDRLGMSIKQFFSLLTDLAQKKAYLVSLKEDIDTRRDPVIVSLACALERMDLDLLGERTKRSLDKRKQLAAQHDADGTKPKAKGGRPPVTTENFMYALKLIKEGASVREAAKASNLAQATLYRKINIEKKELKPDSSTKKPRRGTGHIRESLLVTNRVLS